MQAIIDKAHETREVDLSAAARGVWLVKVPKYLAEKWQRAEGTCDVGKLRISNPRFPGGKPEVMFSLNDRFAKQEAQDPSPIPKDHKFVLTGITGQCLSILTQAPSSDAPVDPNTGEPMCDLLSLEGKVIQRAECKPVADANYIKMKKTQMVLSNKPQRQVEALKGPVLNYKPVAAHSHNIAAEKARKEEGKRPRLEKDKVMDMLFAAFEKHQYYNIKDLVRITQQPVTYLKEILKEICTYNMKLPHKNMWELKPEYRHYKQDT